MTQALRQLPPDPLSAARFLVTVRRTWAFLGGEPGEHRQGDITLGEDNRAGLARLREALEQKYPGVDPAFIATRVWTNLLWQPAYLAVIGVYFAEELPPITRIAQIVDGIFIADFRLPPGPALTGSKDALIERAGSDLAAFVKAMLAEVNAVTPIKRLHALRLVSARLLRTLIYAGKVDPGAIGDIREQAKLWLDAMNLNGQGDIEMLAMPDGETAPILKRKGCCLDYLITPDQLCLTCPKQSDAIRHGRERADYLANME